ncbi:MAG: 30S ribosomal protein S8 [Candidatus Omnitrophica bacterium]|nr:30S ribosomal protein S8 [Candidatus Omnitrophota bacterium]
MSRTDLIADVFTIMRNAIILKRDTVDLPASNNIKSIIAILKNNEYIDNFKLIEDKKQGLVRVYLKYTAGKPAIRNIKRISKPGLRVYVPGKKLPSVLRGKGLAIISTSKGVITDKEAREQGVGGEVIGYVW